MRETHLSHIGWYPTSDRRGEMTKIANAEHILLGTLEIQRELSESDWLLLGRMYSAISTYAGLHGHSLSPLTGSNMLIPDKQEKGYDNGQDRTG